MATSQNNTAYTMATSVGLFGGGQSSAGYGNDAQGYGGYMTDSNFQVPFTVVASTGVFTVNTAYTPYVVNGTPVTLGYTSQPVTYTATSGSPAVFTAPDLLDSMENDLVAQPGPSLMNAGNPVVLLGTPPAGFTATVPSNGGAYNPNTSQTVYYMAPTSGSSFNLATSLANLNATTYVNSTSAITPASASSTVQIVGAAYASSNLSPQVVYYIVSASGATFNLALTVGGAAITTSGAANNFAGILQFDLGNQQVSSTVGANQVAYGTGYSSGTAHNTNGYVTNGYRTGAIDTHATGPAVSLDENPQLAWQNVAGATCQTGYANSIYVGGTNYGTPSAGWGAAGGYLSGQNVDELRAPLTEPVGDEELSAPETAEHRRVRLTQELSALKAKSSRTAKENARAEVVENALRELR